jgi:hypothetical protein
LKYPNNGEQRDKDGKQDRDYFGPYNAEINQGYIDFRAVIVAVGINIVYVRAVQGSVIAVITRMQMQSAHLH